MQNLDGAKYAKENNFNAPWVVCCVKDFFSSSVALALAGLEVIAECCGLDLEWNNVDNSGLF